MMKPSIQRRVWQLFAELLSYPRAGAPEGRPLVAAVRECQALVAPHVPEAAALLEAFGDFVAEMPPGRLEELYTSTFDLDPTCHPYVGYHLLGESYKRSAFLVGLKERYRAHGFSVPTGELPDHLSILLRFLAVCDDPVLSSEIVHEALLPALARMTKEQKTEVEQQRDPLFPQLEGTGAPMPAMPEEAPITRQERAKEHPYLEVLRALRWTLEVYVPYSQVANDNGQVVVGGLSSARG